MQLYGSRRYAVISISRRGKKKTPGIIDFKGLPSVCGSETDVLAIDEGIVVEAGRACAGSPRQRRLGTYVTLTGRDGVTITYSRLASRSVKVGDRVIAGQQIGVEGSTGVGTGRFLRLEFRRNGRLIDGCAYLGLKPENGEYSFLPYSPAEVVCKVCNIPIDTRRAIDRTPGADYVWQKILDNLRLS